MKTKLILCACLIAVPLFAATVTYKISTGEITAGVPTGHTLNAGPGEGTLTISAGEYSALIAKNQWPPPWKVLAGALAVATAAEQNEWRPKDAWEHAITFVSNRTEQAQAALANKAGDNDPRFDRSISLGGYLLVTNVGTNYDAVALSRGLGTAIVNLTGCVNIRFGVYHNQAGTGTITYQLFNVTTATEAGSLTDAAGAGERVLSAVFANTASGINQLRVRARSTVATDDPVYYGGSILLQ